MVTGAAIDDGQRFGGAWTEVKLDAVNYYLNFYTDVLKNKPTPQNPFELWYIDAFAGSGYGASSVPLVGYLRMSL